MGKKREICFVENYGRKEKILNYYIIIQRRGDYDFSPPTRVDNLNNLKILKKWKKEL